MNHSTADYLNQLEQDRQDLVSNLETQGISGLSGDETFTELVPEVLNIETGGGSGGLDWEAIGYTNPLQQISDLQVITQGYLYAKNIYDNWDSSITSMYRMYATNNNLLYFPSVDISNVTALTECFGDCQNLHSVAYLNTSGVKSMARAFSGCSTLSYIPVFNLASIGKTGLTNTFNACGALSDESLDNILVTCKNATNYAGTKTLYELGFRSTYYSTSRIQALSHYQDFINAGWTIGY